MNYVSARDPSAAAPGVSASEAIELGLAPDGGLLVPKKFPNFDLKQLDSLTELPGIAERVLAPFFQGDPLEGRLSKICASALNFPSPLKSLARNTAVLELFHGPTAAFKDFGARFLAGCLEELRAADDPERTVLVATSGDTGGAVASAFFGRPGFRVIILFPKGKVSERQQKQLTCWGGNVHALAVRGSFDDCQRLVKLALPDPWWRDSHHPLSANSINIGRLLPQMSYYARASLEYFRKTGQKPGLIIPSGNLGNSVAALWARRIGLPIGPVILATNANHSVGDYFRTGQFKPHPTLHTLANAMDVGNPSNMERISSLFPTLDELRKSVSTVSVSDDQISETIRQSRKRWGEIWCPHTATAVFARECLDEKKWGAHWILVSTAHPAKFDTIVEPLTGERLAPPPELEKLLHRKSEYQEIDPDPAALKSSSLAFQSL